MGQVPAFHEYQIISRSGEDKWLHHRNVLIKDDRGSPRAVEGIITDITDRKQAEKGREEALAQLMQAQKMESMGTLSGGIAHDFNNILGVVLGNAELALEVATPGDPARDHLKEIVSVSHKAAGIVQQMLNYSRKSEIQPRPIQLFPVVRETVNLLRATIPVDIEIQENFSTENAIIIADSIQMNQVILNICINAVQAMEGGSGCLTILGDIQYQGTGRGDKDSEPQARIRIMDTGPGIDPKITDRIFDPYFTTKEVGKGSGMGLSVVMGIVNLHNGRIRVHSGPGRGTCFELFFPLVDSQAALECPAEDRAIQGQESILLVDDKPLVVDIYGKILRNLGYTVKTETDPLLALGVFKEDPGGVDLVITDMSMPVMDGLMLYESLVKIRSDIPVILCTGHRGTLDTDKAVDLGMDAVLMKPVPMKTMARTVRDVLDRSKSGAIGARLKGNIIKL